MNGKLYVYCGFKDYLLLAEEPFEDVNWDCVGTEEDLGDYLRKVATPFNDGCAEVKE